MAPQTGDFFQTRVLPNIAAGNIPDAVSEVKRHMAAGGSLEDVLEGLRGQMRRESGFGPAYYAYICLTGLLRPGVDPGRELRAHVSAVCLENFGEMYQQAGGVFPPERWHALNKRLFFASLHGLGVNNWENHEVSGEHVFLRSLLTGADAPVVFDVGANVGNYSQCVKDINASARVFSFEPHPGTYARLRKAGRNAGFAAFNFGLSDKEETTTLYDRGDHPEGSSHASLYSEVIASLHRAPCTGVEARFRTLDDTMRALDIGRIDLLKIDTEGHELAVLRGAEQALRAGTIDCIHFEFNEMNVVSRVFLRDFYAMLPGYDFYRMLPGGLMPLGPYGPPALMELFIYQNIVAIRNGTAAKTGTARVKIFAG